jgi:hypothetical protein
MRRRSFLASGIAGVGLLAGCSAESESNQQTPSDTTAGTQTDSPTATTTASQSPDENPKTIFVDTDGSIEAAGTKNDPIGSIQTALLQASPGDTIQVRSGVYQERIEPPRGGQPDNPITITGPPDAILKSDPRKYYVVLIRHSHIHLTGLTVNGLENSDAPGDVNSYSQAQLVQVRPLTSTDEYLTDIVVSPHRIGNTQKSIVSLERTQNAEIGPFRVIGPAGTKYLLTGRAGHNGEIVYVGTSPSNLETEWHPWAEYDQSNNILIHHIDNTEGHKHSELVNTKLGTHNITVEYCTDGGGSQNTEDSPAASVRFQSFDAIARWCDLRSGKGNGIEIGSYKARDAQETQSDPSEIQRRGGTDNAAYGNRITGFGADAIAYPVESQTQTDQRHVCNNEYDGQTMGDPDSACPSGIPTGDGIGHTGGDSPWG